MLPTDLPRVEQNPLSSVQALLHEHGFRVNIGDDFTPQFDVFISHASEDKDDVVRPLAFALKERNISV